MKGIAMFSNNIDIRLIERAFYDSLRANGIAPYSENFEPELDGELHRFRTFEDKAGAKSGAYKIFCDGWPHWFIQDFRKHSDMIHISLDKDYIPIEDRRAYLREHSETTQDFSEENQARQKENQVRAKAEKEAILRAWQEYSYPNSRHVYSGNDHRYLRDKGIETCLYYFGIRLKASYQQGDVARRGELLIPIIDAATREFRSFQHINKFSDGRVFKGFFPGIPVKGGCVELFPYSVRGYLDFTPEPFRKAKGTRSGNLEASELFLCEGLATGLSVLEILSISGRDAGVVVCLSCGNISHVARIWRERDPKLKIIVAADNDAAGVKAAKAAIETGYADSFTLPPVEGLDWNDWLVQQKQKLG